MRNTATIRTLGRTIPVLIILLFAVTGSFAQMNISGINEAQFIYRAAEDSLSNFFHNETNLKFNYRNIDFGMTFTANLPRYSHFDPVKDLHPRMVQHRWEKFYVAANLSNMTIRAGSFNDFFGNGLILRTYRDKSFDWDTTLSGLTTLLSYDLANIKALYGALPNNLDDRFNDTVAGIDIASSYLDNLTFGASILNSEELWAGSYRNRLVYGGRAEVYYDAFDIMGEYAQSVLQHTDDTETSGSAVYAYGSKYIGPLTFSAGYKKYKNFDYRLNDLPTLNTSEEPISERFDVGFDEEGLLGKIQFFPSLTTQLTAIYSEAWNSGFDIRQSDLYIDGKTDLGALSIGFEYGQLEGIDKERKEWFKETTPAIFVDTELFNLPSHFRVQYKIKDHKRDQTEETHYFPLMQYDVFFNKFSLSFNAETRIQGFDDLSDNPPLWLGLEISAKLFAHTDLKAFIGEEKGGKVCRNGQCFYTSPFQGIKLDLTTRF